MARLSRYRHRKDAKLTAAHVRAAHKLYQAGMSVRDLAAAGWEKWGYASPASAANALYDMFARGGYPLRDRVEATVAKSLVHGKSRRLARDRDHRHRLRVERGEIRGQRCEAVKARPGKGRGERCERYALAGSVYCLAHDPARRPDRERLLAHARDERNQTRTRKEHTR